MTKTSRQTNENPSTLKDIEAIRVLAYQKWEAAGCPEDDGTEFWLDAEQEINVE